MKELNPYNIILETMSQYPTGIPMRDGKVSPAFREYIELLFTPEEAKKQVEKYFGDIPAGPPIAKHETWVAKMTGSKRETT